MKFGIQFLSHTNHTSNVQQLYVASGYCFRQWRYEKKKFYHHRYFYFCIARLSMVSRWDEEDELDDFQTASWHETCKAL